MISVQQRHPRVWDLEPGDTFRGRTITAISGVVGLASRPVAVIFFSDSDQHPARISAAHSDAAEHGDEVVLGARDWIRRHDLHEGDAVDLVQLRAEVLAAAAVG